MHNIQCILYIVYSTIIDNNSVKPSVNLGAIKSRKYSLEVNILRDYGLVCHLEELRVPLDYYVSVSGYLAVTKTVFYNQTSMKDRVILEGLTPYQSYNISLRAAPSFDLGKTPSLFSNSLKSRASTLKDGKLGSDLCILNPHEFIFST